MSIYESNIQIEVIEKDHIPYNIRINHKFVHSSYDPYKEAQRQVSTILNSHKEIDTIICYKVGLAYIIENLILNTHYLILWIEPFTLIQSLALKRLNNCMNNFDEIYKKRIRFLESLNHELIQEISSEILRYEMIYLKSYLEKKDYVLIDLFYRKKFYVEVNYNTIKKFEKNWIANFYKNIIHYNKINFVNKLNNICKDCPALIVAGGPSLDDWINEIKRVQEYYIIITVDTALKALIKAGIIPDFVISVDAQVINYLHMECKILTPVFIICDPVVSHLTIKQFLQHHIFLYNNSLPIVNFIFSQFGENVFFLKSGGSVTTTALDFANFIGCRKVFFVGLDFSFPQKRIHTKFSSVEYRMLYIMNRLNHLEFYNFKQLTSIPKKYCLDQKNEKVRTNDKLLIFKTWFEKNYMNYKHMELYLLYGGGCTIRNFTILTDKIAFLRIQQNKIDKEKLFSQFQNYEVLQKVDTKLVLKNIYEHLKEIHIKIKEILNILQELTKDIENQNLASELYRLEKELFNYEELKMIHFYEMKFFRSSIYKENIELSYDLYKNILDSITYHINYLKKSISILHFLESE